MENRQSFNTHIIRENRDLVLSKGFFDRKDRVSLYLQEIHEEYGIERMTEIARTGSDPLAVKDAISIESTITQRGNGFFVPIRMDDVRALGVKKGDIIQVDVKVVKRKRVPNVSSSIKQTTTFLLDIKQWPIKAIVTNL